MRYELTDFEWAAIKQMLPSTPRGALTTLVVAAQAATCRAPKACEHLLSAVTAHAPPPLALPL